jgi:hypothetical protein
MYTWVLACGGQGALARCIVGKLANKIDEELVESGERF